MDSAGLRRGDVVNIEIQLRSYRARTPIPVRERAFQLFQTFIRYQRPVLLPPAWLPVVISPYIKRPGGYVEHSFITIVEVKNEWSYSAPVSVYLRSVDRNIFVISF